MKLLLTSVFKPFGIDDEFNTRRNPWEQMHSSITRVQGVFSIHTHNRSYCLTLMAENLKTPTTVLDMPTLDEFKAEVGKGYTHVGISFIVPNVEKARVMAEYLRDTHPEVTVFIGGHGAQIDDIKRLVPCHDVCRGDGVAWLRRKLGENPDAPIFHPAMPIEVWRSIMGIPLESGKALIIPGVGCNNHCNFCSTSNHFQGYQPYFRNTREMFDTLVRVSDTLGVRDFWLLDENFLGDESRVYELIDLMEKHRRPFSFDMFGTLESMSRYTPRDLARLGVQFLWVGIESKQPLYKKTIGHDARSLFAEARRYGISMLASSILFFDHHDRFTIHDDIKYTISLNPDFTFFTTLSPCPGTPLWNQLAAAGRLLPPDVVPEKERTSQGMIWFRHPVFTPDETRGIMTSAYRREYETLGPCLLRYAETKLMGYQTLRALADPRLDQRLDRLRHYALEMRPLLRAFERFAPNETIRIKARSVADSYEKEFGQMKIPEMLGSFASLLCAHIENGRVRRGGKVRQPATFIDRYRQP